MVYQLNLNLYSYANNNLIIIAYSCFGSGIILGGEKIVVGIDILINHLLTIL